MKSKQSITALAAASLQGHVDIIKVLLRRGADVNKTNERGVTALMLASSKGHTAGVRVLLEGNASVCIKDEKGRTALMYASKGGHVDTVNLLLRHGASVSITPEDYNVLKCTLREHNLWFVSTDSNGSSAPHVVSVDPASTRDQSPADDLTDTEAGISSCHIEQGDGDSGSQGHCPESTSTEDGGSDSFVEKDRNISPVDRQTDEPVVDVVTGSGRCGSRQQEADTDSQRLGADGTSKENGGDESFVKKDRNIRPVNHQADDPVVNVATGNDGCGSRQQEADTDSQNRGAECSPRENHGGK